MGPVLRPMASRKSSAMDQSIRTELGTRGGKRDKRYKSNVYVTEVTFLLQVTDSVTFALLYSFENRNKTMSTAVDSFGNSVLPAKDVDGFCPECGGEMIAKCGPTNRHHWAHKVRDCDTWSDSVTPWHLAWQDCFPRECQEVWMGDNNEHRADVKGEYQILEVQKSPISATEIAERESFYGNMSWMLCGEDFENRFELFNFQGAPQQAKTQLGEIDSKRTDGEDRLFFAFKWKSPRSSWKAAKKPICIHFSKGIARILHFNSDNTGVIEFITIDRVRKEFDPRFDPLPVQQTGKGFQPLLSGFLERCIQYKQTMLYQYWQRCEDYLFDSAYGDWLSEVRDVCRFICNTGREKNVEIFKAILQYSLPLVDFVVSDWYASISLEQVFTRCCPESLEILANQCTTYQERFASDSCKWREFYLAVKEAEDLLCMSVIEYGSEVGEELAKEKSKRMLCSHIKAQPIIVNKFINYYLDLLAPKVEQYSLCARFVEFFPECWGDQPEKKEMKKLIGLLPWRVQGQILERVNFRSEKHLQDQMLEQEKQEAARVQSEEAAKRSLEERLRWPLDEHAGHLARAFDGEDMGSTSLAVYVAMFPDSIWADEISDEQLRVAKERLKGFNPVEVWR